MEGRAVQAAGAREIHRAPSVNPPQERNRLNTPNFTREILVEGKRAPPIPNSRREFELRMVREIVARLSPGLSDDEKEELEIAACKAERVRGISPKPEFLANLTNDLFMCALGAFAEIERQAT